MAVKRSHMITRSYLEAWANERNLVYVVDAESNGRIESINSATVIKYGYRTEHTTFDLEAHYSRTESNGVEAFRTLRSGSMLNSVGQAAVVEFLDMHLERGRYADQAKVRLPIVKGDFSTRRTELTTMGLGDRLALSQSIDTDVTRLGQLSIDRWRWHVMRGDHLITGDGAVVLWKRPQSKDVVTVTFPISPTQLLAIGDITHLSKFQLNDVVLGTSRRWVVGRVSDAIHPPR